MQQYHQLLKDIKEKGTLKTAAREGMPSTLSLFGYQMRFNLSEGFPLVTTKQVSFKNILTELLWFMKGDTNVKFLIDRKFYLWNEDYHNWKNENLWVEEGDMGYQYPWLWRSWGKMDRKWQPKPSLNIKSKLEIPKENTKSSKVGKLYKTNFYSEVLVLDYLGKNLFKVQFQDTGTITEANSTALKKGNIKDIYAPSVLNIACCGKDNDNLSKNLRRKLYHVWTGILKRCYDRDHLSYPSYGAKGIFVDNRWLCFEYFVEDVIKLDGWKNKEENWNSYQIDKDLYGRGYIYSKNDCVWLSVKDNLAKNERTTYFTFRNKETGEEYTTNNVSEFGRRYDLGNAFKSAGTYLSRGRLKSYKGWELLKTKDVSFKGIDQLKELIDGLKSNPMSRRHIITAWNPATLNDMALNACHSFVQFNCRPLTESDRKWWYMQKLILPEEEYDNIDFSLLDYEIPKYYLDCQMYQRSADSILGVPYNIASYALLTEILAKLLNMIPGDYVHTCGDAHIYESHLPAVEEQLQRECLPLPKLNINTEFWKTESGECGIGNLDTDAFLAGLDNADFINCLFEDIQLSNYKHQGKLVNETKLFTGLKK